MRMGGIEWVKVEISPRFYEIDSYGVVNHMFFLGWFEMGRFEVARRAQLLEKELVEKGIFFLVSGIRVKYIEPVTFLDEIELYTSLFYNSVGKLLFLHFGRKKFSGVPVVKAISEVVCMVNGKVAFKMPHFIDEKLMRYIEKFQGGQIRCVEEFLD